MIQPQGLGAPRQHGAQGGRGGIRIALGLDRHGGPLHAGAQRQGPGRSVGPGLDRGQRGRGDAHRRESGALHHLQPLEHAGQGRRLEHVELGGGVEHQPDRLAAAEGGGAEGAFHGK